MRANSAYALYRISLIESLHYIKTRRAYVTLTHRNAYIVLILTSSCLFLVNFSTAKNNSENFARVWTSVTHVRVYILGYISHYLRKVKKLYELEWIFFPNAAHSSFKVQNRRAKSAGRASHAEKKNADAFRASETMASARCYNRPYEWICKCAYEAAACLGGDSDATVRDKSAQTPQPRGVDKAIASFRTGFCFLRDKTRGRRIRLPSWRTVNFRNLLCEWFTHDLTVWSATIGAKSFLYWIIVVGAVRNSRKKSKWNQAS